MVRVAALSDIGCKRANNEDSFGYDEATHLYVVSDGMGGSAAGEVASHLAVQTVLSGFRRMRSEAATSALQDLLYYAVLQANSVVYQRSMSDPRCSGMGSTLVAMCLDGTNAIIANVGDSRAYLLRSGSCTAITQDHSLGAEQMRMGVMPPGGESDGLMKHLSDDEIRHVVNVSNSVEQACAALIHAVKQDGAQDNVTCLLIEV